MLRNLRKKPKREAKPTGGKGKGKAPAKPKAPAKANVPSRGGRRKKAASPVASQDSDADADSDADEAVEMEEEEDEGEEVEEGKEASEDEGNSFSTLLVNQIPSLFNTSIYLFRINKLLLSSYSLSNWYYPLHKRREIR